MVCKLYPTLELCVIDAVASRCFSSSMPSHQIPPVTLIPSSSLATCTDVGRTRCQVCCCGGEVVRYVHQPAASGNQRCFWRSTPACLRAEAGLAALMAAIYC